jgi:hypothetical protein
MILQRKKKLKARQKRKKKLPPTAASATSSTGRLPKLISHLRDWTSTTKEEARDRSDENVRSRRENRRIHGNPITAGTNQRICGKPGTAEEGWTAAVCNIGVADVAESKGTRTGTEDLAGPTTTGAVFCKRQRRRAGREAEEDND